MEEGMILKTGVVWCSDKIDEPKMVIFETETDSFLRQILDCKFIPCMSEHDASS